MKCGICTLLIGADDYYVMDTYKQKYDVWIFMSTSLNYSHRRTAWHSMFYWSMEHVMS
jgi:hypothetical protein